MKSLTAIIFLVISLSAFSAEHRKVIKSNVNIEIGGLRCVTSISLGEDYKSTELINDQFMRIGFKVKLNHVSFSTNDCDMEKLNEIIEPGRYQYGFISADTEIIQITEEPRLQSTGFDSRTGRNGVECVQVFEEAVKVDLGKGIVLSSMKLDFKRIPVSKCKK